MEVEWKALADYVELLRPWIGDKRTARTVRGTIEGILASQTLRCTQIAAFSPMFAGSESAYKRVRRLVHGETRKRSELSEGRIREGLQAVAVERLAGAEEVWVALDTTDLRKPHATAMEALMEVRDLEKRPVPGYRVLNALGRTPEARGSPLYHRLYSSKEVGFKSEPYEYRQAVSSVGGALRQEGEAPKVTWLLYWTGPSTTAPFGASSGNRSTIWSAACSIWTVGCGHRIS